MNRFNIRVYGIYIQAGKLLLTDEIRFGVKMTKLPGGGLEFGEGLIDGLRREWQEELDADIEVGELVYINPFLQVSSFNAAEQVLCVYYRVRPLAPLQVAFRSRAQDFVEESEGQQVFRWHPLRELQPDTFTFPIDQSLVPHLKALLAK